MKRLAIILPLLVPLAGCFEATKQAATTTRTICAPWKPIPYSGSRDTPETVDGVRTHNQTGRNLRCWK